MKLKNMGLKYKIKLTIKNLSDEMEFAGNNVKLNIK